MHTNGSEATSPVPPPLPWASWQVGQRVVVRYEDAEGAKRDALGTLLENAVDYLVIDTRRGAVKVHARQMIVGRIVLPTQRPRASFER